MPSLLSVLKNSENKAPRQSAWLYLLAAAVVGGAALFQGFLIETFGLRLVFLMFFPPIMLSAWFGGWRVGVFATLLAGFLAQYFFTEPLRQLFPIEPTTFGTLGIFVLEGFVICAFGEARLQSRRAMLAERDSLEARVLQRTQEITRTNAQLAQQIAEREQAQSALLESEAKFRSVVQTANDAIVMSDAAGRITFWNGGAEAIFGYAAAEVLGQPLTLLMPSEMRLLHLAGIERLEQGREPQLLGRTVEVRGRRRDGSELPLELSLSAWQIGENTFYSGILRDLTERRQAEDERVKLAAELAKHAEAEAAEERYRLLAEAIPQIVWTANATGALDYFNQRWFEYSRMEFGKASNWGWQEALHPEDLQRCLEQWTHSVATGADYEIEFRIRHHSGVYRWHLVRALPLRDVQKRVVKWFGTCTDIDDQKRTENASRFLAQAGAELAAQLDESAIVSKLCELCVPELADWCFVDFADGAEGVLWEQKAPTALFRAAQSGPRQTNDTHEVRSDILGRFELHEGDATTPRGPWLALCAHRADIIENATPSLLGALTRPGEPLEALRGEQVRSLACLPLMARGRALGVLTLAFATPEKQPAPREMAMLEDLARGAALMIDNARLLHELQQANLTKDEFLAVLSHELRTPLTAILGWVQLLHSGQLDEETKTRALQTIDRNTRAQARMIEDLLDLSRIVTGKLRLEIAPLRLNTLIEATVEAIRPAAQAKSIELFVSLEPDNDLLNGDAHRLQQAISNLLSNAVKFTPQGGRIEVQTRYAENSLEISVRDTGQGIAPEFLPHVFDRFRQADSSSTRRYGGLGLGLAIVRHVMQLHGGNARVLSEGEGHGSTFILTLPLVPPAAAEVPVEEPSAAPKTAEPGSGAYSELLQGVRVMVVDDERDARDILSAALTRYGAQVQACASVRDALAALPNWQPRVLVSDIGMPQEDGYDLIRQVRALAPDEGGRVPAMALTAYARTSDRERALEMGFNRHVAKPIDPALLAAIVAELALMPQP